MNFNRCLKKVSVKKDLNDDDNNRIQASKCHQIKKEMTSKYNMLTGDNGKQI